MKHQLDSMNLHVGYLMQTSAPDLSVPSGPQLHVAAVVHGLQKLDCHVRTVAFQHNKLGWSDDLKQWTAPSFGITKATWFRLIESSLRRAQYELKLPFLGFFDSVRYADACCHVLDGCDILYERHSWMGYGSVFTARRLGIPLIVELNGNIIQEVDEIGLAMSPLQRRLSRWLVYQGWMAADHIVVVSESLKQTLVRFGIPEQKISVVLNGVHLDVFTQQFDKERVREQYNLHSGAVITFVGSFQPWHGVDLLVSSYKQLQARLPGTQLVLVGDGAGRDRVVELVNKLGLEADVKLLGRLAQDQVAAILSVSDVAVAPYPFEHAEIVGTPLKLLEYMAAGVAIVASTAPLHDVITDSVTGLRVAPASAEALARGISRLLEDGQLRIELSANARCQAQQKHSWDHTVEQLVELFKAKLPVTKAALIAQRSSG